MVEFKQSRRGNSGLLREVEAHKAAIKKGIIFSKNLKIMHLVYLLWLATTAYSRLALSIYWKSGALLLSLCSGFNLSRGKIRPQTIFKSRKSTTFSAWKPHYERILKIPINQEEIFAQNFSLSYFCHPILQDAPSSNWQDSCFWCSRSRFESSWGN